jgi:hypothetical protein
LPRKMAYAHLVLNPATGTGKFTVTSRVTRGFC